MQYIPKYFTNALTYEQWIQFVHATIEVGTEEVLREVFMCQVVDGTRTTIGVRPTVTMSRRGRTFLRDDWEGIAYVIWIADNKRMSRLKRLYPTEAALFALTEHQVK